MQEEQEKVNSFILYTEQWPAIALLNDMQRSCLMQAIFALHGACPMPEMDDMTKAIFLLMKPRFEENKDKYAAKCEANKANGKKGGRPKKQETERPDEGEQETERFVSENPKTERFSDENPKTLSYSYTDSDPDTDLKSPPPPAGGQGGDEAAFAPGEEKPESPTVEASYPDMGFVQFLDAYPAHKRDEGAAWQAWLTLSRAKQLPGLPKLLDAITEWERSEQWQKDNGQYVPMASSFLAKRRFLDTPQQRADPKQSFDPDRFAEAAEKYKNRFKTGAA